MQSFKKHLEEKLKASDDMGTWVKDFQKSDAPQFKGKSQKKRQQMAVAAKLSAERNEEVELDEAEMSLYDKIKAARANPSPDKPVRGRGSKNRNPKTYDVRNTLDKEDDRLQAMVKKKLKKEEVELDEVLDTPKAMDSYRNKAKYSKDRAANSAAAKMLRNKNGFHSTDTSQELKTMDKRTKGLKMADKNATKKTFKALRGEEVELDEAAPKLKGDWLKKERERNREHDAAMGRTPTGRKKPVRQMTSTQRSLAKMRGEEVELDEVSTEKLRDYASAALQDKNKAKANKRWKYASKAMDTVADREVKAAHARKYNKMESIDLDEQTQYDLVEAYLLENNIDVDTLSVEQLDEIIGKVVGGAFKVGAKAAVGAGRLLKKAVVNKQGNVRGSQAAKNDAMKSKLDKLRKQRTAEVQRQKLKKDIERAKAKLAATKSRG